MVQERWARRFCDTIHLQDYVPDKKTANSNKREWAINDGINKYKNIQISMSSGVFQSVSNRGNELMGVNILFIATKEITISRTIANDFIGDGSLKIYAFFLFSTQFLQ